MTMLATYQLTQNTANKALETPGKVTLRVINRDPDIILILRTNNVNI